MGRRRDPGPAGVLLVDKPAGPTSHDVVAAVRRARGGRVGHAGTLDPFATGLLVVLLGPATRLMQYVLDLPKCYIAVARLGWRSTTGDPDGELTETGRMPRALELPTGRVRQRLPMTSAARVGGERLYEKAHRGETVETPEREVEVHRAELVASDSGTATFEIECSTGTYVRTLVETLRDAYCESLRRTSIGRMRVEEACADPLEPAEPHDPSLAVAHLPAVALDDEAELAVRQGRPIEASPPEETPGGGGVAAVRLMHGDRLVAVGESGGGLVRPKTVLA